METLSLAVVMNHELADRGPQTAFLAAGVRLRSVVRGLRSPLFITYAIEIEGEAPLSFCTEAVDD
jgi:hypothetical protein